MHHHGALHSVSCQPMLQQPIWTHTGHHGKTSTCNFHFWQASRSFRTNARQDLNVRKMINPTLSDKKLLQIDVEGSRTLLLLCVGATRTSASWSVGWWRPVFHTHCEVECAIVSFSVSHCGGRIVGQRCSKGKLCQDSTLLARHPVIERSETWKGFGDQLCMTLCVYHAYCYPHAFGTTRLLQEMKLRRFAKCFTGEGQTNIQERNLEQIHFWTHVLHKSHIDLQIRLVQEKFQTWR